MNFQDPPVATTESMKACANATVAMTARQRLIAVLLLGANFMLSVDFSILNVALPEVGRAVGLDLARPFAMDRVALEQPGIGLGFSFTSRRYPPR